MATREKESDVCPGRCVPMDCWTEGGPGAQPIWRLCCSLLCGRFRVDAKTLRVSGATPNLLLDVVLLDRRLLLLFLS